jgi:hypothetical protein
MITDSRKSMAQQLAVLAPPRSPADEGWASAASAVIALRSMQIPIVMRITALGHPPIMVDPRHNAYHCADAGSLPERPRLVLVETQAVGPETGPAFELPGSDLDALMWQIGLLAFPDRSAPWLREGQPLRLRRWPNLTALDCGFEQVSMVSLLANAAFTPAELADASGQSLGDARSVINALSLMGVLAAVESAGDSVTQATADVSPAASVRPALERRGIGQTLLSRLRLKFGL